MQSIQAKQRKQVHDIRLDGALEGLSSAAGNSAPQKRAPRRLLRHIEAALDQSRCAPAQPVGSRQGGAKLLTIARARRARIPPNAILAWRSRRAAGDDMNGMSSHFLYV